MFKFAITGLIAGLITAPALALELPHAEYRETGSNRDWVGIYSPDRGLDQPTSSCAIYSRPKSTAVYDGGKAVDVMRGERAAFISWNGDGVSKTSGEVSFMIGLPVVRGQDIDHVLTVDGKMAFSLVGVSDRLYVRPKDDVEANKAIRLGNSMVVTARTTSGKIVKDEYSLFGVQRMTDISKVECR